MERMIDMTLYTIGQIVTYDNKKWIIDSFTIDGNGQTQAILRRGCYREIVDIERLEDGRE